MSVAQHLNIKLTEYDQRIRTFIPDYDEMLDEVAALITLVEKPQPAIIDFGIGTGALAARCLRAAPQARLTGVDADAEMLELARRRLAKKRTAQLDLRHGDFLTTTLPRCDAIVATLALHHIHAAAAKQQFYAKCYAALKAGLAKNMLVKAGQGDGLLYFQKSSGARSVNAQTFGLQRFFHALNLCAFQRRKEKSNLIGIVDLLLVKQATSKFCNLFATFFRRFRATGNHRRMAVLAMSCDILGDPICFGSFFIRAPITALHELGVKAHDALARAIVGNQRDTGGIEIQKGATTLRELHKILHGCAAKAIKRLIIVAD